MSTTTYTPRQRDIIKLVAAGLSNKAIGDKLGITEKSVKFHITNIFKKCNVKKRTELIVKHYEGELNNRPPEVA